jgi:hypothetical protein
MLAAARTAAARVRSRSLAESTGEGDSSINF